MLRQASCHRNGRHTTPTQRHRFRRRPLASHTFVHRGNQRLVLHSNPFDRRRVLHADTIWQNAGIDKAILLNLFFRGSLPSYSPNLNLIERLWKFTKCRALYGRYHPTFRDFQAAIQEVLDGLTTKYAERWPH